MHWSSTLLGCSEDTQQWNMSSSKRTVTRPVWSKHQLALSPPYMRHMVGVAGMVQKCSGDFLWTGKQLKNVYLGVFEPRVYGRPTQKNTYLTSANCVVQDDVPQRWLPVWRHTGADQIWILSDVVTRPTVSLQRDSHALTRTLKFSSVHIQPAWDRIFSPRLTVSLKTCVLQLQKHRFK